MRRFKMHILLLAICFSLGFPLCGIVDAFADGGNNITVSVPEFSPDLLRLILIITVLGVAPSLLMTVTAFTRIVVVLSILRNAIGLQQSPPNVVIISLAMFLTLFVMNPVLKESYDNGLQPWMTGEIDEMQALERVSSPFHRFMLKNTTKDDLAVLMDIAKITEIESPEDTPYKILVPAFMIGELRKAFEMGFLIFLPFLVIDLLVASILMTMGMMMMPPVVVALPFKIIFFVLVDGWQVIAAAIVKSFEVAI